MPGWDVTLESANDCLKQYVYKKDQLKVIFLVIGAVLSNDAILL